MTIEAFHHLIWTLPPAERLALLPLGFGLLAVLFLRARYEL
jgi:hypothetical protein